MNQHATSDEFTLPVLVPVQSPSERAKALLTPAETAALQSLAEGHRIKEMAFAFGVSESAIKGRLRSAKKRLGARTMSQCVAIASALRLVHPMPTQ